MSKQGLLAPPPEKRHVIRQRVLKNSERSSTSLTRNEAQAKVFSWAAPVALALRGAPTHVVFPVGRAPNGCPFRSGSISFRGTFTAHSAARPGSHRYWRKSW